jgi:hypothetical protein
LFILYSYIFSYYIYELLVFGFIISFDVPALHPSISQLDLKDLCGSRAFSCFRVGKIPPVFIWLFPLGF